MALRSLQRRRIGSDNATNFILVVERHRRIDVVSRSSIDQEIGDGAMGGVIAALPAGRPADYAERVVVAFTDDIPARIGQSSHDIDMTGGRRPRATRVASWCR